MVTAQRHVLWAHSAVLAVRSDVLKRMIEYSQNKDSSRVISVVGFSINAVQKLLDFLYSDTFETNDIELLLELLVLGCEYRVTHLVCLCEGVSRYSSYLRC